MKRWGSLAGSVLAILLMGTIVYFYGRDLRSVDFSNPALLPSLALSVLIYSLVVVIGAVAWKLLLGAFRATPAPWSAERQLLIAQIGKYVPGNVAQFVGRAALAIKAGIPARTVGMALLAETGGILVGGVLAAVIALALAPAGASDVARLLPPSSGVVWLGAIALGLLALIAGAGLRARFGHDLSAARTIRWGRIALAIALYVLALLLLGLSLHAVVAAMVPQAVPVSLSVAVFAAAWVAGMATPGAPGGLGIRESVITLGLTPLVGGPTALSAALLHRGVSVLGDVLCFGLGLLLPAINNDSDIDAPSGEGLEPPCS